MSLRDATNDNENDEKLKNMLTSKNVFDIIDKVDGVVRHAGVVQW